MLFGLTTPRLILRPLGADDVTPLIDMVGDVHVVEWLTGMAHAKDDQLGQLIDHLRKSHQASGSARFAVATKGDQQEGISFIGAIGLNRLSAEIAEFWIWLKPRFWEQGYGQEASRAILNLGLTPLEEGGMGLADIIAYCAASNVRVQNLLEKCGFQEIKQERIESDIWRSVGNPIRLAPQHGVHYALSHTK